MAAPPSPEDFVRWFRQAAPYLHAFGERTFVIGFGGELIAEHARFAQFIQDLKSAAESHERFLICAQEDAWGADLVLVDNFH